MFQGDFVAGLISGNGTMWFWNGDRCESPSRRCFTAWPTRQPFAYGVAHTAALCFTAWPTRQPKPAWPLRCEDTYTPVATAQRRRYVGAWQNGVPHGRGNMTWADDDELVTFGGEWRDGLPEGRGTMVYRYALSWLGLPAGTKV